MTGSRESPRIALFGLLGSGNLGNDGSFEAVLAHLRRRHPDAHLTCVCAGAAHIEERYGVTALPMHWYREREGRPRVLAVSLKALGKVLDAVHTFRWVRDVDVVIVPGMGVLEATLRLRPWGFPYALLLVAAAARLVGTKLALVSVGAAPTGQPLVKAILATVCRLAHYRSYRDILSREAVAGFGVDVTRDQVYQDLAFALPAPEDQRTKAAPKTVGVGVMTYHGTNQERRQAGSMYGSYVSAMRTLVRWLVDNGYLVRLFTGDPVDTNVASMLLADVRAHRPGPGHDQVEAVHASSLGGLMRQLAHVDAVVASRYHNVLSALKLAKPTISVSYAEKNDVLMERMGLGRFCQSIRAVDVPRLIEQLDELIRTGDRLRADMHARNQANTELAEQQLAVLSSDLLDKNRSLRWKSSRQTALPERC